MNSLLHTDWRPEAILLAPAFPLLVWLFTGSLEYALVSFGLAVLLSTAVLSAITAAAWLIGPAGGAIQWLYSSGSIFRFPVLASIAAAGLVLSTW